MEQSTDTCYITWMNLNTCQMKEASHIRLISWFHLKEMSRILKSVEAENRLNGCLGLECWKRMTANGWGISFRDNQNVLQV